MMPLFEFNKNESWMEKEIVLALYAAQALSFTQSFDSIFHQFALTILSDMGLRKICIGRHQITISGHMSDGSNNILPNGITLQWKDVDTYTLFLISCKKVCGKKCINTSDFLAGNVKLSVVHTTLYVARSTTISVFNVLCLGKACYEIKEKRTLCDIGLVSKDPPCKVFFSNCNLLFPQR